jgi:dUTP pyrophosphatase
LFVYLAHPIDLAGHSSWLGSMLGDLNTLLVQAGIGAFRPGMAYLANTSTSDHVERINDLNNIAIHQADALIAVLPSDVPTLGTPVEIEFALSMRKPVVIFTDIGHSVQVAAWTRRGAMIMNMADPEFVWPVPETFQFLIESAPGLAAHFQEEKPCLPIAVAAPPVLQVLKDGAANLTTGRYRGDAGIDLAISGEEHIPAGESRSLPTGVHVAIPEGYFGLITGRSSTWRQYQCRTQPGVIDSGYRGELIIMLKNESRNTQYWQAGTRLAQLILLPVFGGGIETVDELPEHERGLNGYGSSGR